MSLALSKAKKGASKFSPGTLLPLGTVRFIASLKEPLEARASPYCPEPSAGARRLRPRHRANTSASCATDPERCSPTSKTRVPLIGDGDGRNTQEFKDELVSLSEAENLAQQLSSLITAALHDVLRLPSMSKPSELAEAAARVTSALHSAQEYATQSALELLGHKAKCARLVKELDALKKEYGDAVDVGIAADARIQALHRQMKGIRSFAAEQKEEFDRRLVELEQATQPRHGGNNGAVVSLMVGKKLDAYRSEDVRRLEEEVRGLYAASEAQEKELRKFSIAQEKLGRLEEENSRLGAIVSDLEAKNDQLRTDVRSLLAKIQTRKDAFDVERASLQSQINRLTDMVAAFRSSRPHRLQKLDSADASQVDPTLPAEQRQELSMALAPVSILAKGVSFQTMFRYFARWRIVVASRRRPVGMNTEPLEDSKETLLLGRSTGERRLVLEKRELSQENAELHERVDAQHKHIQELSRTCDSTVTALQEAERKLYALQEHAAKEVTLVTSGEDLQVSALKAYNLLFPVVEGIKRRLKLTSFNVEPLRLIRDEDATEHVAALVVKWINEKFAFLHDVFTIDDRLVKICVRLSFLSVKLRMKLRRVAVHERFERKLPSKTVLNSQFDGFRQLLDATCSLASHVRATRSSLFVSSTPAKQAELVAITSTFEAEVEGFFRRLKQHECIQFQLALEVTHLEPLCIAPSTSESHISSAASSKNQGLRVRSRSPPDAEKRSSLPIALTHTRVGDTEERAAVTSGRSPVENVNDPFESRKHHSLFIGAVLRAGPDGKILPDDFKKLLDEEEQNRARQRKHALAPEMLKHQRLLKASEARRAEKVRTQAKERQLHGGLQHFVAHSGAIIPFRSNMACTPPRAPHQTVPLAQRESLADILIDSKRET